ncbi:phytoene desaturase family protein [Calycomorphotria hydatis]|uniref:Diapolycopene oxygenase n=1 Tax=Calycomorphotria hydatis TaxID=2528027 RepID=A0A517T5R2_9PLAN|nr:phytoene desaturase family protein [Calycomorphotria hydatis]QDT63710.1 Diapolycopene oxygenase [Calycomorphotria hydatis]
MSTMLSPAPPTKSSSSDAPVAVIGAGLGGLASACVLAARGYRVVLFDKNPWLGGKAAVLHNAGFRFDMGPTILTLPSVLKRIFAEANRDLSDYMELVALDPQWRCFFDESIGGGVLDLVPDVNEMTAKLNAFTNNRDEVAKGYQEFLKYAERLDQVSDRFFFWQSVGGIMDTFKADGMFNLDVLKDVLALRMGSTVAGTVRKYVPEERVAQMIDHFTQYVGSAPDQSPAVLCGIAHMQTGEGIWYPMGGTRAIPEALMKLAEELGVEFRPNTHVEHIETSGGKATAIRTADGEMIECSAVVSNSDSVRTHRELIDGPAAGKFLNRREYEPACSGVVLYLGLKQKYEHILHHNFVFSRDAEEEFETIYRKGEPAPDPTCYVCAPSLTEPDVAPDGGEALYILVHTPFLRDHHDWSKMLPDYRRVILEKLKRTAGMEDIEDRIVVEHTLTPQDINDRYHVLNGAIYGLASHGRFFGAFKPANRSKDIEGLYLAGGSAHPGPGMPMVLMSGWIAADTLDRDGVVSKS